MKFVREAALVREVTGGQSTNLIQRSPAQPNGGVAEVQMRIGFEEERRQRQMWWEEMERPRPVSECPEIMPKLVAQINWRYATDEDGGRFGAVGRHIGRIDWDADASGEQRIGGTNRVRFDWTNWDDRCRFRTLDDQEYELLWFTTRCPG